MVRRLLLLSLTTGSLAVAGWLFWHQHTPHSAEPNARRVESPHDPFAFVIDVPAVIVDETGVCNFEVPIENRTGEVVRFRSLSCSCTCTSSQLVKQSLAPGESTTLRLSVHTGTKSGSNRFVCYLADDRERQWTAGVQVELLRAEGFDAPHVSFGVMKPSESVSRAVFFRQHAASADQLPPVPDFTSEGPGVSVVAGEPVVKPVGRALCREVPVTCTATSSNTLGYTTGTLRALRGGRLVNSGTSIPIDWTVRAAIEASPVRVVLTPSQSGETTTRRVILQSSRGEPFRVLRATVAHPALEVRAVEEPGSGATQVIEVGIRGELPTKTISSELVVHTDHPESQSISVTVTVLILPESTGGSPPGRQGEKP